MKARLKRVNGLRVEGIPTPNQHSDDLLRRVEAISLNRGELRSAARAADGVVPGWDVAGTVIAQAPNGKGPTVGARVVAIVTGGGWAEQVSVPVAQAAVVPEDVALEVGCDLTGGGADGRSSTASGRIITGQEDARNRSCRRLASWRFKWGA